jgi:hypothetical protein
MYLNQEELNCSPEQLRERTVHPKDPEESIIHRNNQSVTDTTCLQACLGCYCTYHRYRIVGPNGAYLVRYRTPLVGGSSTVLFVLEI